jgi:hypothetical protein
MCSDAFVPDFLFKFPKSDALKITKGLQNYFIYTSFTSIHASVTDTSVKYD